MLILAPDIRNQLLRNNARQDHTIVYGSVRYKVLISRLVSYKNMLHDDEY